ncbi:MAG: tetratricopeptide repeat protein, partial [Bacteroidota bacterium]
AETPRSFRHHKKKITAISNLSTDVKIRRSKYQQLEGYATFLVKIFPVANLNAYEKWLLYQFAVMPAVHISYRDSKRNLNLHELLGVPEKELLKDFPEALNTLVELGWLKRYNYGFIVHHLIQEVILFIEGEQIANCESLIYYLGDRLDKSFVKGKISGLAMLPFVQRIYDLFEVVEHDNLGSLYNNAAVIYEDALGDYQQSLNFSYRAMDIYKATGGEFELSISYNSLATTYRLLGDFDKALEHGLQALQIRQKYQENKLAYLGNTYQTLSIIYRKKGQLEKAIETALQAIEIRKKLSAHPERDKRIAKLYNNISIIYRSLGDYDQAIDYAERAVTMKEKYYPEDKISLSTSYSSLSVSCFEARKFEQGFAYALQDLEISEAVLNANHPYLAATYSNIAHYYYYFKEYEQALFYNRKELKILQSNFDANHPDFQQAKRLEELILGRMQ